MLENLLNFLRKHKIYLLIMMDALLLPLALFSAVMLRLGGHWDHQLNPYLWIFIVPLLWVLPLFVRLGLYRAALKYVDDKIVLTIIYGVSLAVLLLAIVIEFAGIKAFPRTAIITFWVFSMAYIGGSRFVLRGLLRRMTNSSESSRISVIIYGAGNAGMQLMMALQSGGHYQVVAFLDDDRNLWEKTYRGIKVYSAANAADLIKRTKAQAILLAIPSANSRQRHSIFERLEPLRIPIKLLPSVSELVSGVVRIETLKEVGIDDLLGRDQIPPNKDLLDANIRGKVVMITGAGGSIGSEICRQVAQLEPKLIVLFELNEYALYAIDQELGKNSANPPRIALLGSVTDKARLSSIISSFAVKTVYHCAAYKHVPMVEHNPVSGIINNSLGTNNCAEVAEECGVDTFVLISTDKAVRPTNVMGASKRLAELCLQAKHASNSKTRFVMVRFGNVLGSSGSVVPLFRQQIASGGPLTVTHPEITRYFMTIPEAAQLVIQAGAMGSGGDVFVLDMGSPIKIVDLARRMIHLTGLEVKDAAQPDGDIEIQYSGLRPGEKLYEELLIGNEALNTTHPRILRAQESFLNAEQLDLLLLQLKQACLNLDSAAALSLLHKIVPEFSGEEKNYDWLAINKNLRN